jgi:hypothetical protein
MAASVSGLADYRPDMDAFNAFVDAELGRDPTVQRYETRFVKSVSTALPRRQA